MHLEGMLLDLITQYVPTFKYYSFLLKKPFILEFILHTSGTIRIHKIAYLLYGDGDVVLKGQNLNSIISI